MEKHIRPLGGLLWVQMYKSTYSLFLLSVKKCPCIALF